MGEVPCLSRQFEVIQQQFGESNHRMFSGSTNRDYHLTYMQYGCGFSAPESWINFDASPVLRFERLPLLGSLYTKNDRRFPKNALYGDITKGLPIPPSSCKGIYCSHVLEHLSRTDCETAVLRTFKYLAPSGIFRLVVPDLEQLARDYLSNTLSNAAHDFMDAAGIGMKLRPHGLRGFLTEYIGNSRHLWLWDEKALVQLLKGTGFSAIRRCHYGDSEDPRFQEVEDAERFKDAVAIECRRPA